MKISLPLQSKLLDKSFMFGVATAAFQIEGANKVDGRLESIWDRFCAIEGNVFNSDDGAVACDHYHLWQQDLDLIAQLHVDAYRLSIAWPRVMKEDGSINEKGMHFYEALIDGLNKRGILVYATLYHWDLPQYLEDAGGWLNRETCVQFANYANAITKRLGDKVASYATFNEPWCSAFLGYRYGVHAPGKKNTLDGFIAGHHLLLAHGMALDVMRENAPGATHGIVLNFTPAYGETNSKADELAAQYCDDENSHFFLKPLMDGAYPESILKKYEKLTNSIKEKDLETISKPIDFLGINFYTRQIVKASENGYENIEREGVERTDIGWEIYPDALEKLLLDMHSTYKLPPIYITENGAAGDDVVTDGEVDDHQRMNYLNDHMNAVSRACEKGVNIKGYFAWSLMDNFEWAEGYSKRFGLVYVDYNTQKRTLKNSAKMYQRFLKER